MKNFKILLPLFLLIVFIISVAYAQNNKTTTNKTTTNNKTKIKVYADDTSIPWGDKEKNITLDGNVSITHDTTNLKSSHVIFNQDKKIADSPGKVAIVSKETDFVADSGTCNFNNKLFKVFGNVNGIIKRENVNDIENQKKKDDASKEITEDIKFSCDYAEYNYKTKILNANSNIVIIEKDRKITAEKVKYDANTEVFYLNGNVVAVDGDGQTFKSPGEVIVSVKDGNEYIKAPKVNSTFYVDTEEE